MWQVSCQPEGAKSGKFLVSLRMQVSCQPEGAKRVQVSCQPERASLLSAGRCQESGKSPVSLRALSCHTTTQTVPPAHFICAM